MVLSNGGAEPQRPELLTSSQKLIFFFLTSPRRKVFSGPSPPAVLCTDLRPEPSLEGSRQWPGRPLVSSPAPHDFDPHSFQSTGKIPDRMISLESQDTVLGTRQCHSWLLSFFKSFSLASKALGLGKAKWFKTAKVT